MMEAPMTETEVKSLTTMVAGGEGNSNAFRRMMEVLPMK
jgi:hypothetical protein